MANLFLGRDAFINFTVSGTGLSLIIPALLWLYFGKRELVLRKKLDTKTSSITSDILFWLILIPICLLIAPGTSLLIQKLIKTQPYINTMTAIPTVLIVVYTFMHLIQSLKITGRKKTYAILVFVGLVLVSSSVFITYDHPLGIKLISNSLKIDPEVQEICKKVGHEYVLLPEEIYGQIGEFNSGVNAGSLDQVAHDDLYSLHVAETAEANQAPLFVMRKAYEKPSMIAYYNYEKIDETKNYVVYRYSKQ